MLPILSSQFDERQCSLASYSRSAKRISFPPSFTDSNFHPVVSCNFYLVSWRGHMMFIIFFDNSASRVGCEFRTFIISFDRRLTSCMFMISFTCSLCCSSSTTTSNINGEFGACEFGARDRCAFLMRISFQLKLEHFHRAEPGKDKFRL